MSYCYKRQFVIFISQKPLKCFPKSKKKKNPRNDFAHQKNRCSVVVWIGILSLSLFVNNSGVRERCVSALFSVELCAGSRELYYWCCWEHWTFMKFLNIETISSPLSLMLKLCKPCYDLMTLLTKSLVVSKSCGDFPFDSKMLAYRL